MDRVEVRPVAASETIDLRHQVMWPDQPRDFVVLDGDLTALHFGAFSAGKLIGVGSFFEDGGKVRLRKLAVDTAFQGRGIATALLSVAIEHLRGSGCTELWCDARVPALSFYRRNGFTADGDVFQKKGLDYVIARRQL